ncbi:MAG: leucyl/phenylalanyl-tRNA--protein transferase [Bacteroidota bacterium]
MPVFVLDDKPRFPSPHLATEEGLLAIGGDLSTERLIAAYSAGIFPWYSEGQPIMWFSPSPRLVVFPQEYKPKKSLRQKINQNLFDIRFDEDFENVIKHCAAIPRPGQDGTWITPEMQDAYVRLHKSGYAHSISTYYKGKLAGGLYGVSLGRTFFGESMFHLMSDASKVAYHYLIEFALKNDFLMIDAQQDTSHMRRLGGRLMKRPDFLSLLGKSLQFETLQYKWNLK